MYRGREGTDLKTGSIEETSVENLEGEVMSTFLHTHTSRAEEEIATLKI